MNLGEQLVMNKRKEYGQQLIAYSVSQKKLWQKIPYLTLQADGVSGYLDRYQMCYYWGKWLLTSSVRDGVYWCWIDCATGKIMYGKNFVLSYEDDMLYRIDPEELNASRIIEELKEHANGTKFFNAMTEEQREEIAKEAGLTKIYKRKIA